MKKRKVARALAKEAVEKNRALDWFEELYKRAEANEAIVPWADFVPNPNVVELLKRIDIDGTDKEAVKIGSGFGDDAEYLSSLGFRVTAFDISSTAIRKAKERFPNSRVDYLVANLFDLPSEWHRRFDFVWESYTLQVLPPQLRTQAIEIIPCLLSENADLLIVTRARNENEEEGLMPWPLTRKEVDGFSRQGLNSLSFEDYVDSENPPVRRFRAHYRKDKAVICNQSG